MKFMFFLSGDNVELAKEEALAVANAKSSDLYGRILIADCRKFNFERLAFTHKVYGLVFISDEKGLEKKLQKTKWQKFYKDNFRVRTKFTEYPERKIAAFVWDSLKNPKVKMDNPKTKIDLYYQDQKYICGIEVADIEKTYMERRPHLRPGFHPSSMNPKLARACVNLSSIKKGQTLYDPFCGTGGMLIEAGLIGCNLIGSDISRKMLWFAKKNLESYKMKYKIFEADATKVKFKCDAIVSDPPYGIMSSLHKREKIGLYEEFLDNAYRQMKKGQKLVFVLPSTTKFKTKFKNVKTLDQYVHGSLTRRVYVMVR